MQNFGLSIYYKTNYNHYLEKKYGFMVKKDPVLPAIPNCITWQKNANIATTILRCILTPILEKYGIIASVVGVRGGIDG